ncbi:MAG: hypothetical protein CHKLHMKO_00520 [Candidatus Argoarchaeum ethanivorans]|uniref:Uncharacterized protein n=1 Tax=Candidatus Argoarchaeum ethanivorans TaxID=2608793 RepID=A0A811TDF3_9EURY|nr:MAG: hypothetical protein CHKLHMKO_00520 [Candidatus Argoarchaeum ethanivorans]
MKMHRNAKMPIPTNIFIGVFIRDFFSFAFMSAGGSFLPCHHKFQGSFRPVCKKVPTVAPSSSKYIIG